ncbi:UDP-glucosyltransferase 2-like [Daktulosphaira vitifoliae]|uniref:UDP-glucosyltransferase 2-like n=1 Tax=Daktulosphaira vitifoliae TaxID=58002 RepID=UPI0021AA3C82|nr:UDP-glucosyltransferase 2-like [Daktulosphaira vitifoliae]
MLNIGGSRILAIETIAGKSHWNFMRSILRTLSERGHQVTVFTPFPDGNRPNYTEIDLSFEVPIKVGMNVQDMLQIFSTSTGFLPVLLNMTRYTCEIIYQNVYMEEILNESHKFNFDLVITEPMCSSCVDYAAAKLKLPMIYLMPSPMITYKEREFYGHIPNLATTSHVMARYARPRTFWERFSNVKLHLEILYALATNEKKLKNLYPMNFDYIDSIRSSLTFINTHYITEVPNSLPLDVVQVGGIHLSIPKPIPNVSTIKLPSILNYFNNYHIKVKAKQVDDFS